MSKTEGSKIGNYAAGLEEGVRKGQDPDDTVHHLGDDTGAAISRAYRSGGTSDAADVIDDYLDAFNDVRKSNGLAPLTAAASVKNFGWAFAPNGINDVEQADVREEFLRRY
ncbi:MAG: hypothetical protein LH624_00845 [Cryobacterium sp.]|nr:hypothetical protein [Cryobacterium sp.]